MAGRQVTRSVTAAASGIDYLQVGGVSRMYGDRRVLTDVTFTVAQNARVGLIGENGSGKTTLLRIIAGREQPDTGVVHTPARVGLLWQVLPFAPTEEIGAVLDDALAEAGGAVREVERAATAVSDAAPGAGQRLEKALVEADRTDAWTAHTRRGDVVAGLGLASIHSRATVAQLSGGQRSRLALPPCCWPGRPHSCSTNPPTTSTTWQLTFCTAPSLAGRDRCCSPATTALSSTRWRLG